MTRVALIQSRKFPGERLTTHVSPEIKAALDAWIGAQPDPKPLRADAVRIGLKDWLIGLGLLSQYDDVEALNQRIDELRPKSSGEPTPARGMAMLRKARAKNELAKLRDKREQGA